MAIIGIMGGQSRETAACLMGLAERAGQARAHKIIDLERALDAPRVDILVSSGSSGVAQGAIESQESGFFIMDPDQKDILPLAALSRAILITYGFNSKVCVTASSVTENEMQICVQRDLPAMTGAAIDQQEFAVPVDTGRHSPDNLLAAITAALAAGIEIMVLSMPLAE